jgi:hypothetical protein
MSPIPRIKVKRTRSKRVEIDSDHSDHLIYLAALLSTFGTTEFAFADQLLNQVLNATKLRTGDPISTSAVNAALAAVAGIGPRDETEAMLAVQMVATHTAAMEFLRQSLQTEYRHHLQDAGNLAVKLLRTYSSQLEALQRYRGKGQQKVTVEHVHVNQGGQAIVGNVATTTRGVGTSSEAEEQPHAQLAHAPEPTLPCPNPEREPVPIARSER